MARPTAAAISTSLASALALPDAGKSGPGTLGSGVTGGVWGLDGLAAVVSPNGSTDSSAATRRLDIDAAGLHGGMAAGGNPLSGLDSLAADMTFSSELGQAVQLTPEGRLGSLDALETAYSQDRPPTPDAAADAADAGADAEADGVPAMTIESPAAAAGLIDICFAATAPVQVALGRRRSSLGRLDSRRCAAVAADEPIGLDRMCDTARSFQLLGGSELLVETPAGAACRRA